MRVAAGAPTSERCIGTVLASRLGESRPALPVWPRRARTRGQPDDRHSHNPSDGKVDVSQPQIEPESQQRRLLPAAGRDHEPKAELEELRAVSGLAHTDMLARPVARCLGLRSHEMLVPRCRASCFSAQVFYNCTRRHSSLGMQSPAAYERLHDDHTRPPDPHKSSPTSGGQIKWTINGVRSAAPGARSSDRPADPPEVTLASAAATPLVRDAVEPFRARVLMTR
jgi:hypothetical protein